MNDVNIVSCDKVSFTAFEKACKELVCSLYDCKDNWRIKDTLPDSYCDDVNNFIRANPSFLIEIWDNIGNELKSAFISQHKEFLIKSFKSI